MNFQEASMAKVKSKYKSGLNRLYVKRKINLSELTLEQLIKNMSAMNESFVFNP